MAHKTKLKTAEMTAFGQWAHDLYMFIARDENPGPGFSLLVPSGIHISALDVLEVSPTSPIVAARENNEYLTLEVKDAPGLSIFPFVVAGELYDTLKYMRLPSCAFGFSVSTETWMKLMPPASDNGSTTPLANDEWQTGWNTLALFRDGRGVNLITGEGIDQIPTNKSGQVDGRLSTAMRNVIARSAQ